ncbi:HK97 gp10 family phage protein [Mobiluncus mulieris]|uniref:HK97 gp10 family phage protein n=1 Tax=Mobiluncus mulieris TaxID=2052 RepID=A0A7Y0U2Y8_9ACTO|nr:HK97 gp10 family phage protein [Mobiluncus mulieris]NMW65984.1 HK97 gp10 family phage protein [Mobiluncus mulieris]
MANSEAYVAIEWDEAFFENILKSEEVAALAESVANQAAAIARATAPVVTGAYRDSIHVEKYYGRKRAVAKVVADDEKSWWIESKTGNLHKALGKARL